MNLDRSEEYKQFQYFSSLIGFLLPLLQFFLNLLPAADNTNKSIFLIKSDFLFISGFAAVISYALILIARNHPYFQIAFNRKKHHLFQQYLARTNVNIYGTSQVQTYQRKNPYIKRPYYITPDTLFCITLPMVVIFFILFFSFGLAGQGNVNVHKSYIFIQALSYIAIIALSALTLAIYYIKDDNNKNYTRDQRMRLSKVVRLAEITRAFSEYPTVRLIAQYDQGGFEKQCVFLFNVQDAFYRVVSDYNVDKILSVERFDQYDGLLKTIQTEINGDSDT